MGEVRDNSPSFELKYSVEKKIKKIGHVLDAKETVYYRLSIKKRESKEMGEVIGFSDGNNLYLSPQEVDPGYRESLFSPLERINDSIYVLEHHYTVASYTHSYTGGSSPTIIPSAGTGHTFYVVNLKGSIATLTQEYVSELLLVDDKLSSEFEKEKDKEGLLLLYLIKLLDDGKNSDW